METERAAERREKRRKKQEARAKKVSWTHAEAYGREFGLGDLQKREQRNDGASDDEGAADTDGIEEDVFAAAGDVVAQSKRVKREGERKARAVEKRLKLLAAERRKSAKAVKDVTQKHVVYVAAP